MRLWFQLAAVNNVVLLLAIFQLISSDLDSDTTALLEFTAAVPHVRKLNWKSANSICSSWVGITCSRDRSQVQGIHLPGIGLHGSIPVNTIGKLDALRVLSLRSNYLNGELPSDILSIPSLHSVFLQNNNFSGSIPLSLSPQLSIIDLSYNSFAGEIPSTIGNLTGLSVLNLQFNSLSGGVPNLDLPKLRTLNLSHNSLNGSIPNSLQKFPVSAFIGNTHLCGPPMSNCSTPSPSPFPTPESSPSPANLGGQKAENSRKLSLGAIIAISIAGVSLLVLLFLSIAFCCLRKTGGGGTTVIIAKTSNGGKNENLKSEDFGSGVHGAEKNKLMFFEGCSLSFNLEDLLRASAEVLGKGSCGTAYRVVLDEATTVVVKRLKEVRIGQKEFEQQMEIVNKLGRHPNVVPPLAYYFSKDEKLLVYENMPAGSLSAALHGNGGDMGQAPLNWDSRLNISLGAAKGLARIHSEGGGKFTHGNIKSSNILLNGSLNGCVSDIGLSPMMNHIPVKCRVAGYRAPEVIATRKVSQKSDVYSFGVVLLELLTGKSPIQYPGCDNVVDLPRWVHSVVREEWTAEVFDVELMKYQNIEEEMVQMLQIALSCVGKVADTRPSMDEVVRMIEDIRHPDLESRGSEDSYVQTP